MVKAILFDFYGVWARDKIQAVLDESEALGAPETATMAELVKRYYHGELNFAELIYFLSIELRITNLDEATLSVSESDIPPALISLARNLHSHFVKIGILANLGLTELTLLERFNSRQSLFEAVLSPLSLSVKHPLLSNEVFTKAVRSIDEVPGSCLVVSGHDDYLSFASNFGMHAIRFTGIAQLAETLEDLLLQDVPSSTD
jgi:FMN phosphatase YigB (HAD superfamily)